MLAGIAAAHGAPRQTVLTSFKGGDGISPLSGVVFDTAGNLYGTTVRGGKANAGTAFKLTPPSPGSTKWTRSTLYEFASGSDGEYPRGTLIVDAAGNLYGTTAIGGTYDVGTAFELSPPQNGSTKWRHTVLTSFDGTGPSYPNEGLVADKAGNLYGTLEGYGGNFGKGWYHSGVYELSPPAKGQTGWTYTVIHRLEDATTGAAPCDRLVIDAAGNLYGTTSIYGPTALGTVFELSPPAPGHTEWKAHILFPAPKSGNGPGSSLSKLILDAKGNLYGTTYGGGQYGYGSVFELSPPGQGQTKWTPTVLWSFDVTDGYDPREGNLVLDKAGHLFGIIFYAGQNNTGLAYELTPPKHKGASWSETELVSFNGANGYYPNGALTVDKTGALYGTTYLGGKGLQGNASGNGTVFKLKP
jgi:uncharacterized repeat protein (TIGR03803 family)